jgi:competence protein ComEA
MSDTQLELPDLPRPEPPASWSQRIAGWAETLDLTPTRLLVGVAVLVVGSVVAWRLLAPPPLPPEMQLPFASSTVASAGGPDPSSGTGPGGASGPDVEGAPATAGGNGAEVVVHVAGAVMTPGVQRLDPGGRVIDAVDAAGGAAPDADLSRINLAAPLEDGQQIYVPRIGEQPPPPASGGAAGAGGAGSPAGAPGQGSAAAGGLVNLNQATVTELEELPGVGPAIAQAIVDHREREGPFTSVEGLLDVRGIGDARLAQLRELVTV